MCVLNVFNMIKRLNQLKALTKHDDDDDKRKQWWNNNKCCCECKSIKYVVKIIFVKMENI